MIHTGDCAYVNPRELRRLVASDADKGLFEYFVFHLDAELLHEEAAMVGGWVRNVREILDEISKE